MEHKLGSELRPALTPSPRRDESRVLAKTHIGSAASTAVAVTPNASGTPHQYDAPVPQRSPDETFPHADSFNLENIGRHWRVVLWFAMAALGLAVVTYI